MRVTRREGGTGQQWALQQQFRWRAGNRQQSKSSNGNPGNQGRGRWGVFRRRKSAGKFQETWLEDGENDLCCATFGKFYLMRERWCQWGIVLVVDRRNKKGPRSVIHRSLFGGAARLSKLSEPLFVCPWHSDSGQRHQTFRHGNANAGITGSQQMFFRESLIGSLFQHLLLRTMRREEGE